MNFCSKGSHTKIDQFVSTYVIFTLLKHMSINLYFSNVMVTYKSLN